MIIRKPYAFLIKNFKKIHICLFILCSYIFIKMSQVRSFVSEFISFGTYDSYNEPISRYVSGLSIFALLIIIVSTIALIVLFKYKDKPWKIYLIPLITYASILFVFIWTQNYFNSYNGEIESTNIRLISDLLFIFYLGQFPMFAILFIRIFGLDLKKFEFHKDAEFIELSEEDQEELEIKFDIDKDGIKRVTKRTLRHMNYVYQEHKKTFNIIIIILTIILLKNTYEYIFVINKSYKQGQSFDANGYTITINNSYYTDKNYNGTIISKSNKFVILDLSIKNNIESRELDLTGFHILNGVENYATTSTIYETDFQDLGKTYDSVEKLQKNETLNLIIIYKVDKELSKDKFVLYYQELDKETPHLRKIKLNIEDLSEIKQHKTLNIPDEMKFTILKEKETISIDEYEFVDEISYTSGFCRTENCNTLKSDYKTKTGTKILKISFASDTYEGKDMIDFSTRYGKINYIDNDNKKHTIDIYDPIQSKYYGKYIYVRVPQEVEQAKSIELDYTVRNNRYKYKLK